ncbi:hypothetical protein ACELLULO517_01450 [Acidisoma cellulosilytica]|uniref:Response regulatory domain-containing protein n=1 Tax=Acidisoma cellulosilyticum TaxID=2802395 RepID=A0A964E251_9PROT|nr:hypothetical protein [Acidisoma cellulosilyticum]MCB8878882.1 hypothetical protein [Acidisoma cellulosilyticum]
MRLLLSEVTYASPTLSAYALVAGYDGKRRCVSIVDDDIAHCEMVSDILEPLGFAVQSFNSGAECILALRNRPADHIHDRSQ